MFVTHIFFVTYVTVAKVCNEMGYVGDNVILMTLWWGQIEDVGDRIVIFVIVLAIEMYF